jgi:putative redox protein
VDAVVLDDGVVVELVDGVVVSESAAQPFGQIVSVGRHVLGADEPERLGGHDTGPSPLQYLMAALGACTSIAVRMCAERHGWWVDNVTVAVRHERVPHGTSGERDRFVRSICIDGNLTPEQHRQLMDSAEHCPVSTMLARGSEIISVPD